ncbi:MAG: hypothetical protein A2X53_06695 [Candidatus Rokubacteria bacterium GWA2_70_23]|nr:MAG: hypothetical protein A2X53_06695 [Candidatus Rokubacteria bacterium GWA2_70_23]
MAYRELGVIEIREVLRRFGLGEGVRAIARGTGSDRKTVAKYVAAAVALGLRRGDPPPTDEQVASVIAAVHAAAGGRPADVPDRLAAHRDQIATWLADGLRLTKVHRRLRAQGVAVPYSSLHRFAQAHLGFGAPTVTVRVAEPPPGEAAEVDFGMLGLWFDPASERRRRVYGLLITLCFSRYAFLAITLRQDLPAVLDGLEAAWTFFGGVVRRLVADNLTPVVTRADRYTPGINRVFLEYAQYRGFVVDPAVPAHPTGKPKVERGIPYTREDFFRGESFHDLADMQTRALVWSRDVAGTRLHGTTRQVPRIVFETVEQPTLLPLAPEPFDRPTWARATVHPDHHLQFRHALYSVPTRYIGHRVEVRGDSRLVRIYLHRELIKVHAPQPPGGRATDYTDDPAERAPYAMRAPDACIRQAEQLGPAVGQFVGVLLSGTFPWARLRQAQKLLRLAERYGAARVNAACARALAFELLDVRRVERILRAALEREPGPSERGAFTDARQAKLLDVLETGAVRRLGSIRSAPVDAWLMAATSTDLDAAVRAGRFRRDLYHRLAVLTFRLPPLRERGADVLLLAERFLAAVWTLEGSPAKRLSPEAREALRRYAWPGNIRELRNGIERVGLLSDEEVVSAAHLELPDTSTRPPRGSSAPLRAKTGTAARDAGVGAEDDGARLARALRETGWNISHTAARLGMSRHTVRLGIEKYRLRRERPGEFSTRSADPRRMKCGSLSVRVGIEVGLSMVRRARRRVGPGAPRAPRTAATGDAPESALSRLR